MKNFRIICLSLGLLFTGVSFTACGSGSESTDQQGKEYTSAYVCPMHCEESGSTEAGTCPVCGMDYVKNEQHESDGHTH